MLGNDVLAFRYFEPISVALMDSNINIVPFDPSDEGKSVHSYEVDVFYSSLDKEKSVIFVEFIVERWVGDQSVICVKAVYGIGCNNLSGSEEIDLESRKKIAAELVSVCAWPQFTALVSLVKGQTIVELNRLPVMPGAEYFQYSFADDGVDNDVDAEDVPSFEG